MTNRRRKLVLLCVACICAVMVLLCACDCGGNTTAVLTSSGDASGSDAAAETVSAADTEATAPQVQSYNNAEESGSLFSSCNGDFSLTDEVEPSEDEQEQSQSQSSAGGDRLVMAQPVSWEVQADDEAYMAMMSEQVRVYYEYMAQMAELQPTLAKYRNARSVRANERYAALEAAMLQWANAALDYPSDGLTTPEAISVHTLSCLLADSTAQWLKVYPEAVCGDSDGAKADQLLDSIMDSAAQLDAHFRD